MVISISATNPCHLWELAEALHELGHLGIYYSGYPKWKLRGKTPDARAQMPDVRIRSFPARTLVTYGLLKLPQRFRLSEDRLYPWQDYAFDRKVARALARADFIHAMPGQALETFRRAKDLGITTVLNHASGPVRRQLEILQEERRRRNLPDPGPGRFNATYFAREDEEYRLADLHCCASSIVKGQLVEAGVPEARIWVVPYGSDPDVFPKRSATARQGRTGFHLLFAGQLIHRKGIGDLLSALEQSGAAAWTLDCYGPLRDETESAFREYTGNPSIRRHGAVPQDALASAFQEASVLVLPSAEEAFGLVVVQALQSGLPCIVSDRVGAGDLICHRENGSIVPFGDPKALLEELRYWEAHPTTVPDTYPWTLPAEALIDASKAYLAAKEKT